MAALPTSFPHSAPPLSSATVLLPSPPRSCSSLRSPLRNYSSLARSPASPAMSALPSRRSSLFFPLPHALIPPCISPPPSPPLDSALLYFHHPALYLLLSSSSVS